MIKFAKNPLKLALYPAFTVVDNNSLIEGFDSFHPHKKLSKN